MPDRRVIIVTGASSGIGRDLARQAARAGFAVIAVARRKDRLDALASEIANDGGACVPVVIDVRHGDAPARIVGASMARFGRIDVLVNNAGAGAPGSLLEQTDAAIEAQWQQHVAAPLRITRAALPELRKSGGQAIFIGSGVARVPLPYFGAYCAAKAAIRAAAIQMRRELRGSGVAITYIDPGNVDTEFSQAAGMHETAAPGFSVPSKQVAKRIMRAVHTRPGQFSAVPWQAAGVAIGELFPTLADRLLSRAVPHSSTPPAPSAEIQAPQSQGSDFERALEPVARRMERVKLTPAFLAELLHPGDGIHLGDAAMRWAGMPNKNERAALAEALKALAAAGFLESSGDESWKVLRASD